MKVKNSKNQIFNAELIINNNSGEKFYKISSKHYDDIITEKEFKQFYKTAESKTINYYNELNTLKNKVLERIGKINEQLNYTEIRLNGIDKKSEEGMKLQQTIDRYENDKKYFNDILEVIKDKLVDFQAIQSRVNLEREIDLSELYSQLGIDLSQLQSRFKNQNQDVELINQDQQEKVKEEIQETSIDKNNNQ